MARSRTPDAQAIRGTLTRFVEWLERYGEFSWDFQSYYAGAIGGRAKSLYYRRPFLGTVAVAPMVFSEALIPSARRLFSPPLRFPIADAHYAMGFAFLYQSTSSRAYLQKAIHFLDVLRQTRCPQYLDYCWGYPFDWVWREGVIKRQTPLITTTPYVYEAFLQLYTIEARHEWRQILESIARHVITDIRDCETSPHASSCSYTPNLPGTVINASAYRAFLLTSASQLFDEPKYWEIAERNLNFVLESQNADGSWPYAVDGVRDFVDHFHTCFVMKAVAKIHALSGYQPCVAALQKGVVYYLANLFDDGGLPKPFAKAPRLTVYKHELYDYAECINLCLLLRDRFPQLEDKLHVVIADVLNRWVKRDGSFRSRRLWLGWDNVPMHRWAQSQMFRSLALLLHETTKRGVGPPSLTAAEPLCVE